MALKALMIRKKISDAKKRMTELEGKDAEFETREAELTASIEEAETDEERSAVEEMVDSFDAEKGEHEKQKTELQRNIEELEAELEETEKEKNVDDLKEPEEERKDNKDMEVEKRAYSQEEMEKREAFAQYVKDIAKGQKRSDSDYPLTQGNNGVIVPKTIITEVITKVREICPIFERAHKYPINGTIEIPYYPKDSHGINVAYQAEMDELVASSGDFDNIELTGYLAGALAIISKKLINNTDIDVLPFIIEQMAEGFKVFYEHEGLVGTVNKASGLLDGIASDSLVTGYKSFVTADELIDIQDNVATAYQANACWIMSKKTKNQVKKLKDSNGEYLLNKDFRTGFGEELLGKPVFISDNMPELGTTNNIAIAYGDLSGLAYKITENLEVQVLLEKFATKHAVGILGWTEIDTKVENQQKFAGFKCGSSDPQ